MVIVQSPWLAVFDRQPYYGRHLTSQNHFCDGYAIARLTKKWWAMPS